MKDKIISRSHFTWELLHMQNNNFYNKIALKNGGMIPNGIK